MCGGTGIQQPEPNGRQGLSPRVRGNRPWLPPGDSLRGSIPACAGEPVLYWMERAAAEVYPRVCGGTLATRGCRLPGDGLSPRVRGNRIRGIRTHPGRRSIPACAGEPALAGQSGREPGVYPRVCGGTTTTHRPLASECGLSPRVRGNLLGRAATRPAPRSIPACAGEPCAGNARTSRRPVYPRVCGGTSGWGPFSWNLDGLSPRVRGNRVHF